MASQITEEHRSRGIQRKSSETTDKEKCKWYRSTKICAKLFCGKTLFYCGEAIKWYFWEKNGIREIPNSKAIYIPKTTSNIIVYIFDKNIITNLTAAQKSIIVCFSIISEETFFCLVCKMFTNFNLLKWKMRKLIIRKI